MVRSGEFDMKKEEKIKYIVGLGFCDLMDDHREICFDILIPVQFNTEEEAREKQGCFLAKMEYLNEEVVINIYQLNEYADNKELLETIKWDNYYSYKCSVLKKECIGSGYTDAATDYEPCADKFDVIFKKLVRDTGRTSFTLEDISYWVEPAFENTDIKQWNIENKK